MIVNINHTFAYDCQTENCALASCPEIRIGHLALKPEAAKPAIRQVQTDFFAEVPFKTGCPCNTQQSAPHHQVRIARWAIHGAVERLQFRADAREVDRAVDAAKRWSPSRK
jgi:hypothetical protein